jgi:hypothetical protein
MEEKLLPHKDGHLAWQRWYRFCEVHDGKIGAVAQWQSLRTKFQRNSAGIRKETVIH